ncbi:MAG: OstA-like protein [Bacteroidota bacterium]
MRIYQIILLFSLSLVARPVVAQVDSIPSPQQVNIDQADFLDAIPSDPRGNVQKLTGNVELSQDSVYMYADSAILINQVELYAYSKVIIQQGDSIAAFAERLNYNAVDQIARLREDVVLQNGQVELYTAALDYDLKTKVAIYNTPGRMTNGQTELQSKRGRYLVDQELAIFTDSVVVIDDRFEMRADSLQYQANEEIVYFTGPTIIRSDSSTIYCEAGFYDLANERAEFRENAQFQKGKQAAVADTIGFQGGLEEVYTLRGNAYFEEGDTRRAQGDILRYYSARDEYELEGNAKVVDGDRDVRGDTIIYMAETGGYQVMGGRPVITDGPTILMANSVNFDEETGLGIAEGIVVWRDTSANLTIESARMEYEDETGYIKAIGGHPGRENRPVMITELDGDSLWLAADTLVAFEVVTQSEVQTATDTTLEERENNDTTKLNRLLDTTSILPLQVDSTVNIDNLQPDSSFSVTDTLQQQVDSLGLMDTIPTSGSPDTTNSSALDTEFISDTSRTVLAYNRVRVFKSDLQAVGDSLSFSTSDSILTLYEDPVMWQDSSQLLADTIDVYLRNQSLDKVHLKQRALVVTSMDLVFYNQIKGRDIFAYFIEQELRRTEVDGNAEAIYYPVDSEIAYLGMNETACSSMVFYFKEGGIRQFSCIGQTDGHLVPLPIPGVQPELEGFKWIEEGRPLSKDDIY